MVTTIGLPAGYTAKTILDQETGKAYIGLFSENTLKEKKEVTFGGGDTAEKYMYGIRYSSPD